MYIHVLYMCHAWNFFFYSNIKLFNYQQNKLYIIVYLYVEIKESDFLKKNPYIVYAIVVLGCTLLQKKYNNFEILYSLSILSDWPLVFIYRSWCQETYSANESRHNEWVSVIMRTLSNLYCRHVTINPWISCMYDILN